MKRIVFALVIGVAMWSCAAEPFVPTDANSWAFPADCPDPAAPSPMDLRFLNEKIAGESGPLRLSPDGNDIHYADGRRFAGWMIHSPHGCDGEFTSDAWGLADYQRSARFMARLGVNVGIIGAINPAAGQKDSAQVNPVVLEYLHCSVAANREAGIYTQLRICWFHGIKGGPLGVAGHEDKDLQALVFFHPRVQEIWKAWAKGILLPVNPHTGIALNDDPALFSVEIANEDSLLFYVTDMIQGEARAELERQFAAWCSAKYGSIEKTLAAWNGAPDKADKPAENRLGILIMWMLTRDGRGKASPQRVQDQFGFLVETMAKWNREARRYIKEELGGRHLLVASSNFVPADRVTMDDPMRQLAWADMDLIENNHYFTDGGKPLKAGWRADAGGYLGLISAVDNPLGLPTNKRQVEGKPFLCTEILWPRPHPFEVEGPLLVAGYQALTGIDGLAWAGPRDITWERRHKVYFTFWSENGGMPMQPFSCAGPATLGQFPAAAAIVRLGLVKEALPVVRETRTADEMLQRKDPATAEVFAFDPNQFARGYAQDTTVSSGVPKEAFLAGPVRVKRADVAAPVQVADLSTLIADGAVTSATGELRVDTRRRLFTINAPAARCAVGFLAQVGAVDLSGVRIESSAPHGAVAVVALDGRPIAESRRILVQTGARSVPTGWKESPATWAETGKEHTGLRVDATGDLPWRVQKVKVTITFAVEDRFAATRGTALDGNGNPVAAVPLRPIKDAWVLEVPEGTMYVVLE